ncbi:DUF6636 domain-containing protein [Mycobacterium sp. Marseille-P9652]|uniref:DUF6636 domain-containing protein n=1 Tax=Mycobacterium sp. Marseille-P9652 TaxID=2654950 RepID=UPI0012E910EF|nr:DUF6636 domain-containing protein [Mycobacterium sp. Marseille-P9652]
MIRALLGLFVVAIAMPATAFADDRSFQSPSGNIACQLGADGVACDVSDYTYQVPPGPPCSQHIAWGNRFTLQKGQAAAMACHGDTLRVPGEQTLNYGQTLSAGTITCSSDASGVTCTDGSTGHYFRVSRESYTLG